MTFLGTDEYLTGVLVLNQCLKNVGSKYPLTVLASDSVNNESLNILKRNKISYIIKKDFVPSSEVSKNNSDYGTPHWNKTFGKLYIFGMTEFDKIVYIDSDMLLIKNVDNLFNKENLSAVIAGTKFPGHEKWSQTLNSGLIVIIPKRDEESRLFNLIKSGKIKKGGDQEVIHYAYPDWPKSLNLHLNEKYNLLAPYESYYLNQKLVSSETRKIIHFVGANKPWMANNFTRIKHTLGIIIHGFKYSKKVKGIKLAVKDYNCYWLMCKKINRDNNL